MSGPTSQLHSGIAQAREYEDPHGLLEKTEYLLRYILNIYIPWIRNRLISAALEPVLSRTKNSFIASYYSLFFHEYQNKN